MKTKSIVRNVSILGAVFTVAGACLKTGGDTTSLAVVLIASLIIIVPAIKTPAR